MTRYFTACGTYPEPTKASFNISGPQNADQIPEGVKLLLDMPGITQVDVRFNHGLGERIKVFRKIEEPKNDYSNQRNFGKREVNGDASG